MLSVGATQIHTHNDRDRGNDYRGPPAKRLWPFNIIKRLLLVIFAIAFHTQRTRLRYPIDSDL